MAPKLLKKILIFWRATHENLYSCMAIQQSEVRLNNRIKIN